METPPYPLSGRLWITRLAETLSVRHRQRVENWPKIERERLGDQLIRATDSIGANISEGYVRMHIKERFHFFSIAQGSIEESIFHLRIAYERGLITRLDIFTSVQLLSKLSKGLKNLERTQTSRTSIS